MSRMKFKRPSFGISGSSDADKIPVLDLEKDPAENVRSIMIEITKPGRMPNTKKMALIKNLTTVIKLAPDNSHFGMPLMDFCKCLCLLLISPASEIRAAGLRVFRHLLVDASSWMTMMTIRIDFFIIRSLERQGPQEVERVQTLHLIEKCVHVCPKMLPQSIIRTLVSTSDSLNYNPDRMSTSCLATLCQIAIQNPKMAAYCGAHHTILACSLITQNYVMNEALVVTLLYLINHPVHQTYFRPRLALESMLAPLTDLYYQHHHESKDSSSREYYETHWRSARYAIAAALSSWPGLMYLCAANPGIGSLFGILSLPKSDAKKWILDLLFDIFHVKVPQWTDDFSHALDSIDPNNARNTNKWRVTEDFTVAEALDLLPPETENRVNIIDTYMACMLLLFINAGLFESLVDVIVDTNDHLAVQATILLGELQHMANTLLPLGCYSSSQALPTLVSISAGAGYSAEKRGKASKTIRYLDQFHLMKKRGIRPHSILLEQIVSQAAEHNKEKMAGGKQKTKLFHSLRDVDDIQNVIRESQVLSSQHFISWDWGCISAALESEKLTVKRTDENMATRFVRRLLVFYRPTSRQFSQIPLKHEKARSITEAGLQLVNCLIRTEEAPEGLKMLEEFVKDISDAINDQSQFGEMVNILSPTNLQDTLCHDYLLFIGRILNFPSGVKLLERSSLLYSLFQLCADKPRDIAIKVIVSSLDYSLDGFSKHILNRSLTCSSKSCRIYCTRFLRVLLRASLPYFSNWGIELIVHQLYDTDPDVSKEALSILEEACSSEINLIRLVELKIPLLHFGEKGLRIFTRFLAVNAGYTYLVDMGYLDHFFDLWREKYNLEYVDWVEDEVRDCLMLYQKPGGSESFGRPNSVRSTLREAFLPPHLYGELAQNSHGIRLIVERHIIEENVAVLERLSDPSTDAEILQVKAAIWVLSHIGSTSWGFSALAERKTVPIIVRLAEQSNVYSIIGTTVFALGLIARTVEGIALLESLDWCCLGHSGDRGWPVLDRPQPRQVASSDSDMSLVTAEPGVCCGSVPDADPLRGPKDDTLYKEPDYGGVYLGFDPQGNTKTPSPGHKGFEYTYIQFGQPKKRKGFNWRHGGGGGINSDSLDTKDVHTPKNSWQERHFDVDYSNHLYEEKTRSMIDFLDRPRALLVETHTPVKNKPIAQQSSTDRASSSISAQSPEKNSIFDMDELDRILKSRMEGDYTQPMLSSKFSKEQSHSIFDQSGIYLGEDPAVAMSPTKGIDTLGTKDSKSLGGLSETSDISREGMLPTSSHTQFNSDADTFDASLSRADGGVVSQSCSLEEDLESRRRSISLGNPPTEETRPSVHAEGRSASFTGTADDLIRMKAVGAESSSCSQSTEFNPWFMLGFNPGMTPSATRVCLTSDSLKVDEISSDSTSMDYGTGQRTARDPYDGTSLILPASPFKMETPAPKESVGSGSTFLSGSKTPDRSPSLEDSASIALSLEPLAHARPSGSNVVVPSMRQRTRLEASSESRTTLRDTLKGGRIQRKPSTFSVASMTSMQVVVNQCSQVSREFKGVALPLDLNILLKVPVQDESPPWPAQLDSDPTYNVCTEDSGLSEYNHLASRCLSCMLVQACRDLGVVPNSRTASDQLESAAVSVASEDASGSDPSWIEKCKNDFLVLAAKLSTPVFAGASRKALLVLKEKCPQLFTDLCLYGQVVDILSLCSFSLYNRQCLHAMFEPVDFGQVDAVAEALVKKYFVDR